MKKTPLFIWIIVIALFCVIPFVFHPFAMDMVTPIRLLVLTGAIILGYLVLLWKKQPGIPLSNGILLSLAAVALFSILSGITALNRAEWFNWVCRDMMNLGLFVLLYAGLRQQESPLKPARRFATIVTLILSVMGLIQFFTQSFFILPGIHDIHALFSNRNLLASALFLMLPLNMANFFREKRIWRHLGTAALSLSFLLMTALRTRSVWVALGLALIVGITLCLIRRGKPKMSEWFPRKRVITFFAIAVVFLTSGFIMFELYEQYLGDDFAGKQIIGGSSVRIRLVAWRKSLDMIADHPVLGVGGGNWRLMQPEYRPESIKKEKGFVYYMRPHNDYLWIASEYGVPGFIAYLSVFVFFWLYVLRILRRDEDGSHAAQAILIACGVAGFMSVSFFSFPRERVFHIGMLIFYLAAISAMQPKPDGKKSPKLLPKYGLWSLLVVLAISFVVFFIRLNGSVHLKKAMNEVDRIEEVKADMREGKITMARAGALAAKHQDRIIDHISSIDLALYNVSPDCIPALSYRAAQYFLRGDVQKAYADYKIAYRANPNNVSLLNNYAAAAGRVGKMQEALSLHEKQLDISPGFADAVANLARTHLAMDHIDEAIRLMLGQKSDTDGFFFQRSLTDMAIDLLKMNRPDDARKLLERVDPAFDYQPYRENRNRILKDEQP